MPCLYQQHISRSQVSCRFAFLPSTAVTRAPCRCQDSPRILQKVSELWVFHSYLRSITSYTHTDRLTVGPGQRLTVESCSGTWSLACQKACTSDKLWSFWKSWWNPVDCSVWGRLEMVVGRNHRPTTTPENSWFMGKLLQKTSEDLGWGNYSNLLLGHRINSKYTGVCTGSETEFQQVRKIMSKWYLELAPQALLQREQVRQ